MNIAKKILSTFIIVFSYQNISLAKVEAIIGNYPLSTNPNLITSIPKSNESEIIISREQYVISYNKFNRSPNWVSWKLDKNSLGQSGRTNNFQIDSDLEQYFSASDSSFHAVNINEYKGSCYDRGHQVPSADRTVSAGDNSTTFNMTNMSPQTPYLNRVIWEHLESYSRNLVKNQNKKLFIIAGPIYDTNLGAIGPNHDIRIPSKNFKVIFILEQNQTQLDINSETPVISVIMPNSAKDGSVPTSNTACPSIDNNVPLVATTPPTNNDWEKYKTTLQNVEIESGIKF